MGRMRYDWVGAQPLKPVPPPMNCLLASHQDQVLTLPDGATLLARSEFCPIAAYAVDDHVFCIQPHPEFVEDYSAWILQKRPESRRPPNAARACAPTWRCRTTAWRSRATCRPSSKARAAEPGHPQFQDIPVSWKGTDVGGATAPAGIFDVDGRSCKRGP